MELHGASPAEAGVLVHDETNANIASLLVSLPRETFPMPLGVIYAHAAETFDRAIVERARGGADKTPARQSGVELNAVEALLRKGYVWTAR